MYAKGCHVSRDIVRLMKSAGCREISFGIESGDEEILKRMHKDNTLEKARESIRIVKEAGIKTHASFMIGNLGETEETIKKTINFAKELNTDIAAFFIATPLPGTELYQETLKSGYLRKDVNWKYFSPLSKTRPVLSLPNLSSEKLMYWHRHAIREYYVSPKYIIKKILSLGTMVEILNLYNGLKLFFRIERYR